MFLPKTEVVTNIYLTPHLNLPRFEKEILKMNIFFGQL
jgi:hypothetical protein